MSRDTNLNHKKYSVYPSDTGGTSFVEKGVTAPFKFEFLERKLRTKTYGILGTIGPKGRPHSVGVVYGLSALGEHFCLYLITRPVLRKARNIQNDPNVSFVVPFPHYMFRMLPPASIQFQGRAELISIDDSSAKDAFRRSIVLKRSLEHSLSLGESTFIRIVPDDKIYSFGINASIWQYLMRSQHMSLGNYYITVPESRRFVVKG